MILIAVSFVYYLRHQKNVSQEGSSFSSSTNVFMFPSTPIEADTLEVYATSTTIDLGDISSIACAGACQNFSSTTNALNVADNSNGDKGKTYYSSKEEVCADFKGKILTEEEHADLNPYTVVQDSTDTFYYNITTLPKFNGNVSTYHDVNYHFPILNYCSADSGYDLNNAILYFVKDHKLNNFAFLKDIFKDLNLISTTTYVSIDFQNKDNLIFRFSDQDQNLSLYYFDLKNKTAKPLLGAINISCKENNSNCVNSYRNFVLFEKDKNLYLYDYKTLNRYLVVDNISYAFSLDQSNPNDLVVKVIDYKKDETDVTGAYKEVDRFYKVNEILASNTPERIVR